MKNRRRTAAVLAAAITLLCGAEAYAYPWNYGPGYEGGNIYFYEEGPANNPAYDTGWDNGIGPGYGSRNPMGDVYEDDTLYPDGPKTDISKRVREEADNSIYIHSTHQGGIWARQPNDTWKLFTENGQPVSSQWAYVDGKTYLTDMYGTMQTGWKKVNGYWYYFNSVGAMQTGWLLKDGKYYFLNTDGTMAYGWVNSLGNWYYLDQVTGVMATNTYTPDGRYVSAEGVLVQ